MIKNQKDVILDLLRKYEEVIFGNDPYGFVKMGRFLGVVSVHKGKIVLPLEYHGTIDSNESIHKLVNKNNKTGLFSTQTGNWIIPPKFSNIRQFLEQKEFLFVQNSKTGLKKGVYSLSAKKLVIPVLYDTILSFSPIHIFAAKIGGCGIFDTKNSQWVFKHTGDTGNKVPRIQKLNREEKKSSFWSIEINGKLGIFSSSKNRLIVPVKCISMNNLSNHCHQSPFWSISYGKGKLGIFSDTTGTFIVPAKYGDAWPISDSVAVIVDFDSQAEGLYSMAKGKVLLPIIYNNGCSIKIRESLYLVQRKEDSLYGVFSEETEAFVVPTRYVEPIKHITDELFQVCVDGKRLIFNAEDQTETLI